MLWKAFNNQNTQKCWTHAGCNKWKSTAGSARIRRLSGDYTDLCLGGFDRRSLNETCGIKICDIATVARAKTIPCWSYTGFVWHHTQWPRLSWKGHNWRWVMSLCLWPWNKSPVFPMCKKIMNTTESHTTSVYTTVSQAIELSNTLMNVCACIRRSHLIGYK